MTSVASRLINTKKLLVLFTPIPSEIDISVSKLLGFETFAKSLRVSVSVSENLVSEKKSRFRFRKNLVSEKSLGLGFGKFGLGK